MSFDTTIKNGYTYAVYTSSLTGKNYVTNVYKKPSTEKLGLCFANSRSYLNSISLQPPNVSMSRIKAKINCAFMQIPRPTGENKKDFIGVFRANGNLYADWGGVRTINDSVVQKRFNGSYRNYPLFCINGNSSDIKWCAQISEFSSIYQNYEIIISSGAPLVFRGKNVFTNQITSPYNSQMKIAPSSCTQNLSSCHYNTGIGEPNKDARRTLFGMTQSGIAYLIASDGMFNAEVGAEMMKSLGCYNAVFLDGGGATEMVTLDADNASYDTRCVALYDKASALVVYK